MLALIAAACSSSDDPQPTPQAGSGGDNGGTNGGVGAGASGESGEGGDGSGSGGDGAGAGSGGAAGLASDAGPVTDAEIIELEDDRALSSLSDVEIKDLCTELLAIADTIADADDVARLGCVLLASVFGGSGGEFDVATCEDTVQSCLITGDGVVSSMNCEPSRLREATVNCAVTIEEYRACVVASSERMAEWIDAFSCQTLADPEAAPTTSIDTSAASLPECAPVMAACPALFEPEGQPSPGGCDDTCSESFDRFCDDGGPGSITRICAVGTDCTDCGPR